jgi:hypothetical protein
MLQEMDNCNKFIKEYWMCCNILKGMNNIDAAREEITLTCVNKSGGNCGMSVYMVSEDLGKCQRLQIKLLQLVR